MATRSQSGTSNRGFASMDEEKQRAIAKKGGKRAKEKRTFSRDPGLAAEAGRKGGESVAREDRSFSKNHELAREAGRKGGQRRMNPGRGRRRRPPGLADKAASFRMSLRAGCPARPWWPPSSAPLPAPTAGPPKPAAPMPRFFPLPTQYR
ncbi:MAG: KGG domain-containing protein [Rhodospirillales bacterium]